MNATPKTRQPMTLVVRWGTSRAADTAGYTTCTASIDGKRLGSCCGGGYDLQGAAIAEALSRTFPAELLDIARQHAGTVADRGEKSIEWKHLHHTDRSKLYGLTYLHGGPKPEAFTLDGACGLSCVWEVLHAIGWKPEYIDRTSSRTVYRIVPIAP